MLTLAKAGQNDIFYDLGCGWAQNLIIAAREFKVKRCIGVERLNPRYLKARQRIKRWSLSDRIKIIHGGFEDLIEGKFKEANIKDSTIILYALETTPELVDQFSEKIQEGCRLVYYYNALFPEIKPDAVDYPFYVSIFPFKRPSSELDWLSSVIQKDKSSLIQDTKLAVEELWDELYHDCDVLGLGRNEIRKYQTRLKKFLSSKQQ